MTIKNMIMAGLVCCGFTAALTSCSDNTEAFYTVSEDDGPRILNDDLKGSYEINHNENFVLNILVTPTEMTTVRLYDADRFVCEGKNINQPFETGEYNIKIVATTVQGKETYRNFKLTVNALDGEPVATSNDNSERVVKAGQAVKLHGENLSNITKVVMAGREIAATYNAGEKCVEYTIPADMPNGTYRVSMKDNAGNSYGAGKQSVITKPTCYKSSFSGKPTGAELKLEGRMLDEITTVTIGGQSMTIKEKSESTLVVTVPAMKEGSYDFVATTAGGTTMQFCQDGELLANASYKATWEIELWSGGVDINWGTTNVKFTAAEFTEKGLAPGATVKLYFTIIDMPDGYHCLRVTNDWWSVDMVPQVDGLENIPSPYEFTYTDAHKAAIDETGAMLVVGYGYKLTKVTYE